MSSVIVVQLLVLCCLQTICHVEAGVLCYNCDRIPYPRDCDTITECGSHEQCYAEKIITDDGIVYFRSGCKSNQACEGVNSLFSGLGRRAEVTACSKCCNSTYCNIDTCDVHIENLGTHCLSCNYVLRPEDCKVSILCGTDEMCYTQTIIHNYEKRYRLGCVRKTQCLPKSMTILGRRQIAISDYCGSCCETENCNRQVCSEQGSFNQMLFSLQHPPQTIQCRDNSTELCSKNSHRCTEDYFKFYQCPYTCGQCYIKPQTTLTTTPATTMTTTSEPFSCKGHGFLHWDNTCYYVTSQQNNWSHNINKSTDPCRKRHMQRAILNNNRKNIAASYLIESIMGFVAIKQDVWLGGSYKQTDKKWHWISGEPIDGRDHAWANNHATTADNTRECMVLRHARWESSHCNFSNHFLCERNMPNQVDPAALSTGHPDHHKCTGAGHFAWENNCYFLLTNMKDFKSNPCNQIGMDRTAINNDLEQRAVVYFIRNVMNYTGKVWLGGHKSENHHHHQWHWPNGNEVHVRDMNWKDGEPSVHGEACLSLDGVEWTSESCFEKLYHLCEFHM